MNKEEFIKQSLKRPSDFGYFGDKDLFNTWGMSPICQNRDSSILEKSNFEVITKDLLEKFPDDCEIESFNHWACGWLEQLVFNTQNNSLVEEILNYMERLEEYPIIDEDDYSTREWEAREEYFEYIKQDIINFCEEEKILVDENGIFNASMEEIKEYFMDLIDNPEDCCIEISEHINFLKDLCYDRTLNPNQ